MFTLYSAKQEFEQYALDQKVINPNMSDCDQVVFRMSNGKAGVSRAYEYEGQMVADVPNDLLKYDGNMMVQLGQGERLRLEETTYFNVAKREKPDGYVCTDNRNLKKKYLETIKQDLTEAEKAQARENLGVELTHYDTRKTEEVVIEWDGNTEGRTTYELNVLTLMVKVSDRTPTLEQLEGAICKYDDGGEVVLTADVSLIQENPSYYRPIEVLEYGVNGNSNQLYSVHTATSFPEAGLYFNVNSNMRSLTYTVNTGELKQLDQKYLPDALQFGESETGSDTLTWDGNTEGLVCVSDLFYKVSDATPTVDEVANGIEMVLSDGETISVDGATASAAVNEGESFGQAAFVMTEEIAAVSGIQPGLYLLRGGEIFVTSLTIPGYTGFPSVEKMDEKYLPDSVVQNGDTSIVLTSPNGTKYSVTVSDDGTLTTTAVTE